jgi:hypothetical protein
MLVSRHIGRNVNVSRSVAGFFFGIHHILEYEWRIDIFVWLVGRIIVRVWVTEFLERTITSAISELFGFTTLAFTSFFGFDCLGSKQSD